MSRFYDTRVAGPGLGPGVGEEGRIGAKIDFNEQLKKNLGDVADDSHINAQLPDLLDRYCNDISKDNEFLQSMVKHQDKSLTDDNLDVKKDNNLSQSEYLDKKRIRNSFSSNNKENGVDATINSVSKKQEFGHNPKLSPSKEVKDSKQLSKSFISNKNVNYDKM